MRYKPTHALQACALNHSATSPTEKAPAMCAKPPRGATLFAAGRCGAGLDRDSGGRGRLGLEFAAPVVRAGQGPVTGGIGIPLHAAHLGLWRVTPAKPMPAAFPDQFPKTAVSTGWLFHALVPVHAFPAAMKPAAKADHQTLDWNALDAASLSQNGVRVNLVEAAWSKPRGRTAIRTNKLPGRDELHGFHVVALPLAKSLTWDTIYTRD